MRFEAVTVTVAGSGGVHTHTSEEVWPSTRAIVTPLLPLDRGTTKFELLPHWTVMWTPMQKCAVASYAWKGVVLADVAMAYSGWDEFTAHMGDGAEAFLQIARRLTLPAMIVLLRPFVELRPAELRDVIGPMGLLGDLDRCVACIYFEQMEAAHPPTVQ